MADSYRRCVSRCSGRTLMVTSSSPSATTTWMGGGSSSLSAYRSCTARRLFLTSSNTCGVNQLQQIRAQAHDICGTTGFALRLVTSFRWSLRHAPRPIELSSSTPNQPPPSVHLAASRNSQQPIRRQPALAALTRHSDPPRQSPFTGIQTSHATMPSTAASPAVALPYPKPRTMWCRCEGT